MGKVLILNGSPRAPRSNSKRYAELFAQFCTLPSEYAEIRQKNQIELCRKMEEFTELLLVFPLYADSLPVPLLNFLKTLEENPPRQKPRISVLINCGFLEPEQNDVAVEMVEWFCKQQGYAFGSVLRLGSGEAVLDTPLKGVAIRNIRKLARSVAEGRNQNRKATMPLPKRWFIRASKKYWENYGRRNGLTPEQMATMDIEK